jgi:hypothetical protein
MPMSDFSVRSDNVDVEQIMRQIRARIREKRGVDYTEDEIRELANVKLEKFLDPKGVRSDLLDQFRRIRESSGTARNYAFEDTTLFASSRPFLRFLRRLFNPILKLFFNPNPLIEALHIQSRLNESYNRSEALSYELMHNLVVELTRTGIEVKNLTMRLESMSSRLDFDERRARALEGVVQYRPGAVPPLQPPTAQTAQPGQHNELDTEGQERRSRRRRRRGRKRGGEFRPGAAPPSRAGQSSSPDVDSGASDDDSPDEGVDDAGRFGDSDVEPEHEPVAPRLQSGDRQPAANPQHGEGEPVAPQPQRGEGGPVAPEPQRGEGG